ncbi:MAG: winged helix-turn-helix domain-containing protein, partial [Lacrimispora sphenoides]
LYGNSFIGRVEAVADIKKSTLVVKNIWYEDGIRQTKKLQAAVNGCMKRFAKFNACDVIVNEYLEA